MRGKHKHPPIGDKQRWALFRLALHVSFAGRPRLAGSIYALRNRAMNGEVSRATIRSSRRRIEAAMKRHQTGLR